MKTDTLKFKRGFALQGRYINPLPGTETEVKNIQREFNRHNKKTLMLLYKAANEHAFKSGETSHYQYIHLATHGFVNEEQSELSGILMTQDATNGEDGILYSGEIYNLRLNAKSVVLSVCETGLGKISKGEGIIGLTRTLLFAGSQNIMVSLWPVSDESISNLMIGFYKDFLLINENDFKGFSSSLRRAKLAMINFRHFSYPFYWSPFIFIGK